MVAITWGAATPSALLRGLRAAVVFVVLCLHVAGPLVGLALIVVGVGMLHVAASVIVAGVGVIALSVYPTRRG